MADCCGTLAVEHTAGMAAAVARTAVVVVGRTVALVLARPLDTAVALVVA